MIYVTGDLHGDLETYKLKPSAFPAGAGLTKDDFVVVLGDFGLIWNTYEQSETETYWLGWLTEQPWTTLFIDGNHENFDRLLEHPVEDFNGGKASRIHETVWYLRRGEVFNLYGKTCFVMGGAASVDKLQRTEHLSWWAQEVPSFGDYENALRNLARHGDAVDLVFTHTCPTPIKLMLPLHGHLGNIASKLDFDDPTEAMLQQIRERITFARWYFAHFHLDAQIRDERFTCVYDKILKVTG